MKKLFLSTILVISMFLSWSVIAETVGPNGEKPTAASSLVLTEEEIAQLGERNLTIALVWHEMSEYTAAVDRGARDESERLGIKVIAQTDAGFDSARQKSDVETVMTKSPSIIVSLPVDPMTAASVYDIAKEAGVVLSFVDNAPAGYVHGVDYASVTSDDLFQMGQRAANALALALDKKGKVGWIFHDADFYVTNQRDNAFKSTIEKDYPEMTIVSEAGIADPSVVEDVARAMLARHHDMDGIYVTWAEPALGVLSVLREQGNRHTKLVTIDLSEPIALDMIKEGNTTAIIADEAYRIGVTAVRAAAAKLLNNEVPSFLVVDSLIVTKNNIADGWMKSLHIPAPASLSQ